MLTALPDLPRKKQEPRERLAAPVDIELPYRASGSAWREHPRLGHMGHCTLPRSAERLVFFSEPPLVFVGSLVVRQLFLFGHGVPLLADDPHDVDEVHVRLLSHHGRSDFFDVEHIGCQDLLGADPDAPTTGLTSQ